MKTQQQFDMGMHCLLILYCPNIEILWYGQCKKNFIFIERKAADITSFHADHRSKNKMMKQ